MNKESLIHVYGIKDGKMTPFFITIAELHRIQYYGGLSRTPKPIQLKPVDKDNMDGGPREFDDLLMCVAIGKNYNPYSQNLDKDQSI